MIQELVNLSHRLQLTGREPFASRPINWFIDLDAAGKLVGVSPSVGTSVARGKRPEAKAFSSPRYFFATARDGKLSATAGGGKAVAELGAANIAEIYGVKVEGEPPKVVPVGDGHAYKRANFVDLHRKLAASFPDNITIRAAFHYLETAPALPLDRFPADQLNKLNSHQLSFRVAGRILLRDPEVIAWWHSEFDRLRAEVVRLLPKGRDFFPRHSTDNCEGSLAVVFPHVGVPGGGAWCPLASFDKAPSRSYGLGDNTTPMRLETAEQAAAALNWLLRDRSSHLPLGETTAVFWAIPENHGEAPPQAVGFAELMREADPLEVREFLHGAWGQRLPNIAECRFHAAIVSSPQSRITIRSWHTETLPHAQANLKRWFHALGLPNSGGRDRTFVSIPDLALCTIPKGKKNRPLPSTYSTLFEAALFGGRLPQKVFTGVLARQCLELAKGADKKSRTGFESRLAARTALVKLYFELTKGVPMAPDKHDLETNPGYLCGRLLAVLDKIHQEAHRQSGGTNTSPANRAYGAASSTPALIFPQLCKLVRYHLNKIGKSWAYRLEYGYTDPPFDGLAAICGKLRQSADQEFPRTLSLEDQGRFAIGFYYERCRVWPRKDEQKDQPTPAKPDEEQQ